MNNKEVINNMSDEKEMTLEERVQFLEEENEKMKKVFKKLIKYTRSADTMYDLTGYRYL